MTKAKIKAEIVGHSLSPQGDELISVLCTFPRIILAEVNTHRMLSKNTSSSRAIPFKKMVEAVQENPFIPIAWQKEHTGMQGFEYFTKKVNVETTDLGDLKLAWLEARDYAIKQSTWLNKVGVTKQLCNRLLEPFMWTTMLITGSRESWQNFFNLRCPDYEGFKSRKEASKEFFEKGNIDTSKWSDLDWLHLNKGQAEIHMMALAESIYDAVNESTPKQLQGGEWHIPFEDKLFNRYYDFEMAVDVPLPVEDKIKVSVAMAARTSYTVVGDEKEVDYERMIQLHDRLLSQDPPHSSPLEHCARAMSDDEYERFVKGQSTYDVIAWTTPIPTFEEESQGWCYNLKGFIPYRYMIDNNLI